ncbi:MAG: AAA family ATPase [Bulleidia sp.]|nr:AAA family ATPase [Bulleidia sp.]
MLRRKIMDQLLLWKNSQGKKTCLQLRGVRQCGKTFILRKFGEENYENVVEINFIKQEQMRQAFQGDLSVDTMVQYLSLLMPDASFVPGKTLLFLDEIQECPEARTSLKFWAEDGRYDVVTSGSQLGIAYKESQNISVPVGFEEPITMYPLDFEEFLWACGIDEKLFALLRDYLDGKKIIPDILYNTFLKKLREYMVIGGMPDVVNDWLRTKDYHVVQSTQERIVRDYLDDIAKYASPGDRIKARNCYLSIPRQLIKENHKFQYSVVEKKATARKFESSLDWLAGADMIHYSRNVSTVAFPLEAYAIENQFRIYPSDIGLLCSMYGFQTKEAVVMDTISGSAKGALYESLIADILLKKGHQLYYYKKQDSTLEIEFLLEEHGRIVPVEVKASRGSSNSLNELLKNEEIEKGYKLTSQNTGRVDKKITLPLFMAAFL